MAAFDRQRRWGAVAVGGALLLAGCGVSVPGGSEAGSLSSTGGGAPLDAPASFAGTAGVRYLNRAAERTTEVERFRIEVTTESSGFGAAGAPGVRAVVDRAANRAEITLDGPAETSMIFADGRTYLAAGEVGTLLDTGGKDWVAIDGLAGAGEASDLWDPSAILDQLQASSAEVTEVGTEQVRGVTTTHLRTEIDAASLGGGLDLPVGGEQALATIDVWVDADGLVRRYEATIEVGDLVGGFLDGFSGEDLTSMFEGLEGLEGLEELQSSEAFGDLIGQFEQQLGELGGAAGISEMLGTFTVRAELFDFDADLSVAVPAEGDVHVLDTAELGADLRSRFGLED